jgi:pimeloyl-ACP methyl ester carboxylesterase
MSIHSPSSAPAIEAQPYQPQRVAQSGFVPVRGLSYHCLTWGDPSMIQPDRPAMVMVHGFMDVAASFQFVVDALAALEGPTRYIIAPDWRGFGQTRVPDVDSYWFQDYLGDLDSLLVAPELGIGPDSQVDLVGHSMGGNVVMSYAGICTERIRRLVNLEGFGLPANEADEILVRTRRWLHQLRNPPTLRPYASLAEVVERLRMTNPRLPADKALWLAAQWSEQRDDGCWHLLADPAHKKVRPTINRVDEILSLWSHIAAPLLWVEGDLSDPSSWWGDRYPRAEFEARLARVPRVEMHQVAPSGHMLHHDQPEALARQMLRFLNAP